jgi:N-acetylglucosamine-6-phosphate deacetylase
VTGAEARLANGTLAGSVLTMDQAVRNLVDLGASIEDAVDAATRVPAELFGTHDLGCLTEGGTADLVVLDDALMVERTLVGGAEVFARAT